MQLHPCPLSFNTEGLEAINHVLSLEFSHTAYHELNAKIDAVLAANGFDRAEDGLYSDRNGRKVSVCRLGATIRAIWQAP